MQYCRIDRQITVIQAKLHVVVDGAQKGGTLPLDWRRQPLVYREGLANCLSVTRLSCNEHCSLSDCSTSY